MSYPEKPLATKKFFRLMESGATIFQAAEKFNLSPSRIWQIYNFVGRKSSVP